MDGPSNRQVGWILFSVLGAVLLLDLGLPLVFHVSGPPTVPNTVYLGFCAAQISMHAAIVVLLRGWMMSRAVSIFVIVALQAWVLHRHDPVDDRELLAYIFLTQWLIVAGCMLVLISAGLRLQRFTRQELSEGVESQPAQFSLRGLVVLVTAACLAVGVLTQIDWRAGLAPLAALFAGLFAFPTILLVPSVLTLRRWRLVSLLALVIGSGLGMGMYSWLNRSWEATPLFLVPGVLSAGGLLLMRWLGFRLWRPARVLPSQVLRREFLSGGGPIAPDMPSAAGAEGKNAP